MKYLVMECHPAYAIVLDEKGSFLEVANLNYELGEIITEIYPRAEEVMEETPEIKGKKTPETYKNFRRIALIAASFIIIFTGSLRIWQEHFKIYGTLSLSINPQVKISLSHSKRVRALEALNSDGMQLIEGISAKGERVEKLTDDLVQRALDMGYLKEGGKVNIGANSQDTRWAKQTKERVKEKLEHFTHDIKIEITINDVEDQGENNKKSVFDETEEITIPLVPETVENPEKTPSPNLKENAPPPEKQIKIHKPMDDDDDDYDNFDDIDNDIDDDDFDDDIDDDDYDDGDNDNIEYPKNDD
ncbi:Hypothetical protein ING2D1G_1480 [Peptoniphilus sp. ING2-D1G]|nr:Hypothetical protein ING2D1G_1480 [Peptoniphilus sp. ING2-D1G]